MQTIALESSVQEDLVYEVMAALRCRVLTLLQDQVSSLRRSSTSAGRVGYTDGQGTRSSAGEYEVADQSYLRTAPVQFLSGCSLRLGCDQIVFDAHCSCHPAATLVGCAIEPYKGKMRSPPPRLRDKCRIRDEAIERPNTGLIP